MEATLTDADDYERWKSKQTCKGHLQALHSYQKIIVRDEPYIMKESEKLCVQRGLDNQGCSVPNFDAKL